MTRILRIKLGIWLFYMTAWAVSAYAETKQVTILYLNDFHAAVEPMTATWLVDQPQIGGASNVGAWIEMMRREQPNAFLFDSGDVFTGQAISSLSKGKALVDIFRAFAFDATCLGNHEFDYGIQPAKDYVASEPFPVLSANLFYKGSDRLFAKPYAVIEKYGIKLGVVGVFGPTGVSATTVSTWDTLEVRDPIPILKKLVPELRRQVDLVVVLAHQGFPGPMQADAEAHPEVQRTYEVDKEMVESVPGIDVLVGGHPHRGIEVPWFSQKTGGIVVQTYGRGTTLGYLKLTFDTSSKKGTSHTGSLLRTTPNVFPVPAKVEAVVSEWEKKADAMGKEVLGKVTAPLIREYNGESTIGDVICDAMLWKYKADIAFENAGGIRADLNAGAVTLYDAVSTLPFNNTAMETTLTGSQIRKVLEQSLTLEAGMAQTAGISMAYDLSKPAHSRLLSVEVGGKPLVDSQTYRVVATSFMATGGDNYSAFLEGKNTRDSGTLLSDVLADYFRARGTVEAPQLNRMIAVTR